MIELLRRNPWIGALALLAAALAVVVGYELISGAGSAPHASQARRAAAAESKLLPPVVAIAAEQAYPETAARPLWIPTRRPAPAVVAAPASFARGQFILQGVTIAGDTRIAMLKEKASGRMHRVEKGRDVNGIQIAEIEPDRVTLAQGAEREVLDLRVQRPGAAPAAAPVPAAPSQGPFSSLPAPAGTQPAASPGFGQSPRAPATSVGPLAPNVPPAAPAGAPAAAPASPAPAPVPQQATTAPMSPEELLARRRARRTPSPQ